MVDYSELKRLAEACGNMNWRFQQENWTEYAIRDDHGYIATMRVGSPKQSGPDPDREAKAKFLGAMTPGAILALIAELKKIDADRKACWAEFKVQGRQVDQLKTDNDLLRDGLHDIAKKASESRSLTRRLTWIEGRAESALLGKQWAAHVFMMPDPKNGKPKAERLEAENKQLKAENEALRNACREPNPSADRYQWLRRQKWFQWAVDEQFGCTETICEQDEQIDAAMGKGEQANG